jgi:hypothetical protein
MKNILAALAVACLASPAFAGAPRVTTPADVYQQDWMRKAVHSAKADVEKKDQNVAFSFPPKGGSLAFSFPRNRSGAVTFSFPTVPGAAAFPLPTVPGLFAFSFPTTPGLAFSFPTVPGVAFSFPTKDMQSALE